MSDLVKFEESGLDKAIEGAGKYPEVIDKARTRALKGTSYEYQQEIRDQIETEGHGTWPRPHPLTLTFRRKFRSKGSLGWRRRRRRHPGAFDWLGKFARYRVNREGDVSALDFGRSREGEPGTFDRRLSRVARRVQEGQTWHVTPRMRRLLGAQREREDQRPGYDIFPLRRETRTIRVEPRPIMGPILRKMEREAGTTFERKFGPAQEHYEKSEL